jgi:hypothetical protein
MASLALPYNEDFPAGFSQFFEIAIVSFDVSPAFVLPEFCVRGRPDLSITAVMYMPETAVNKDYLFVSYKYNIRVAGEITAMKSVTITHSMNKGTNDYLRQGILGPNLRHIEGTLLFRKNIHCYRLARAWASKILNWSTGIFTVELPPPVILVPPPWGTHEANCAMRSKVIYRHSTKLRVSALSISLTTKSEWRFPRLAA